MAAGLTISKEEINNVAGSLSRTVFSVMANVAELKATLDAYSAQNLVDTFGFLIADANDLKTAVNELADLATVFNGGTPANTIPHDYRVFARRLLGTGLY